MDEGDGGGLPEFDIGAFYRWIVPISYEADIRVEFHESHPFIAKAHIRIDLPSDVRRIHAWDGTIEDILAYDEGTATACVTRLRSKDDVVTAWISTDWYWPSTIPELPPLPIFDYGDFVEYCRKKKWHIIGSKSLDEDWENDRRAIQFTIRRDDGILWPDIKEGSLHDLTGYKCNLPIQVNERYTARVMFTTSTYRPPRSGVAK